jgi:hypothetical protein
VRFRGVKRLLVGRPLATAQSRHERLGKAIALAVFASDPLSSVAYATEEILLVLTLAGSAALSYSLPIGIAIAILIAIVVSARIAKRFAPIRKAAEPTSWRARILERCLP